MCKRLLYTTVGNSNERVILLQAVQYFFFISCAIFLCCPGGEMGNLVEQLTDERVILLQAIKVFPPERTSEASNSNEIIT